MKIALVTSFFEPIGGQEVVTRELFNQLQSKGHSVYVITTSKPQKSDKTFTIKYNRLLNKKLVIPGTLITDYVMSTGLLEKLQLIKPDIIHVQDEYILPALVLANEKTKIPCICTCHNNVIEYSKKSVPIKEKLLSALFRMRKKNYIKKLSKVDAVISVSEYIKEELISAGLKKEIITTIYNVHNEEASVNQPTTKFPMKTEIVLLALGRLVWYKGFDVTLRAIKIVSEKEKNFKLFIAGKGTEINHLKKIIADYNIEQFVSFKGHLPAIELRELYEHSDIVLLPSIYPDPAPIISLEAMFYGKPIIASNIGGIPEAVVHGVNGLLVPPNNPQKTADAILVLMHNSNLRKSMGQSGRLILAEKFGNSRLIYQTMSLYEKVINDQSKLSE